MVIGGGLTSAQITDMAVRHDVTKVWHVMRGSCKGEIIIMYLEVMLVC